MKVLENQMFKSFDDRDSAAVFSDIEFRECHFDNCAFSLTHDPALRSTVRHVSLIDCEVRACWIRAAVVEDVLIENLKTPGSLQSFGAVFKHVVLRGRFDQLMIANYVLPRSDVNLPYRYANVEAFRKANAEYYSTVDWALDISGAEFKEFSVRGFPAQLVKRDPETQVIVSRAKALQGDWRELPFTETLWPTTIDLAIKEGDEYILLAAPKRHRKFPSYLNDLRLLRAAGVAEPD